MLTPRLFPAAALLLALVACAHQSAQRAPAPASPSASPRAAASAVPRKTAPSRVGAATSPSPAPRPTPVRRAPAAPPRILAVAFNSTVHPGQHVNGSVTTTSNVASVEVRIGGYGMTMRKTGVGTFALDYAISNLAFFMRGSYPMQIIARNAAGARDERVVTLVVQ